MASKPTSETYSRSPASSSAGRDDAKTHSAVHVLRGAVTKVLGERKVDETGMGKISISIDKEPSPQEVSDVEAAANKKVDEDAEVLEFEMERSEAEGHFGRRVYDLSAPKEDESLVRVVRIPDWEASVCPRRHVESTGAIGAIKVETVSFLAARNELEISFRLL